MSKKAEKKTELPLSFFAATKDRWKDLEKLFGERGACAGCWCMVWRRPRKDYEAGKGVGNKRAFKKLVTSGEVPGILAYDGDKPIGWCSVAPRETFLDFQKSRAFAPD